MGPSGARVAAAAVLLLLTALSAACTATQETQPVGLDINQPVRSEPARAWRLVHDDHTLGYVVLFVDRDAPQRIDHQFFSVRNPWQQDLGTVDALGRAWRFVPHEEEPRWLTTGTLLEGAQAILEAHAASTLEELPLAALGAPAADAGG
jgi:hypothetical protein